MKFKQEPTRVLIQNNTNTDIQLEWQEKDSHKHETLHPQEETQIEAHDRLLHLSAKPRAD